MLRSVSLFKDCSITTNRLKYGICTMEQIAFLIALFVIFLYSYDHAYWSQLNGLFVVDKYIYWFTVINKIYESTFSMDRPTMQCPCTSPKFCNRILLKANKEVFTFAGKCNESVWSKFDWTQITTIAIALSDYDPELMCYAHEKGARIVILDSMSVQNITNPELRKQWIKEKVEAVNNLFLDGINLDFEDPVSNNSAEQKALTMWVQETRNAFAKSLPQSQVTFDIAWSPDCIDQRCYDVVEIAKLVDFIFVMAYDEQSQIFGDCVALGNSPFFKTIAGIHQFLELGIAVDKLVLGLPWYGYRYQCLSLTKDNVCSIEHVPFRGVNCSDGAGSQIPLGEIQQILKTSSTGRLWNETELVPYFNYKDPRTGTMCQIQYDDAESLHLKYEFAEIFNLHGVGMWNAIQLNNGDTKEDKRLRDEIWASMPKYHRHYK